MKHISVLRCMRLLLLPLLRFFFALQEMAVGPSVSPGRRCALSKKYFHERSVELQIPPRIFPGNVFRQGVAERRDLRFPSRFDLPLTLQHLHMHSSRKISKLKAISIKRSSHCLSYFCLVTT